MHKMILEELIPKISVFKKIVVTGPQRSGTTVTARIVSHLLQYDVHYEEEFDVDDIITFCKILSSQHAEEDLKGMVLQAPGLSSIMHLLGKSDIAVVFLQRDIKEIQESEVRIDWRLDGYELYEKKKYFDASTTPISEIKYSVWNNFQKQFLNTNWFELDYNSLSSHPFWVEKEIRSSFGARQTEII